MKSKLLVAYETEDSLTVRLTAKKLGEVLYKTTEDQLAEVLASYWELGNRFYTPEQKSKRYRVIQEFLNACND